MDGLCLHRFLLQAAHAECQIGQAQARPPWLGTPFLFVASTPRTPTTNGSGISLLHLFFPIACFYLCQPQ
jgi:hypothetical protein